MGSQGHWCWACTLGLPVTSSKWQLTSVCLSVPIRETGVELADLGGPKVLGSVPG